MKLSCYAPRHFTKLAFCVGLCFVVDPVTLWILNRGDLGGANASGPNLSGGLRRQNLDLPYNAGGQGTEDDELAPQLHAFYGQKYEASALVFALDKSGSMKKASRWQIQTREVTKAITEMTAGMEFGVVYYGSNVQPFRRRLSNGAHIHKAAGVDFVQSQRPRGDTCIAEGVVEALKIVNRSGSRYPAVIVTSDGRPDVCATGNRARGNEIDTLMSKISAANPGKRARVHTIYVGQDRDPEAIGFLKRLAREQGGTFKIAD